MFYWTCAKFPAQGVIKKKHLEFKRCTLKRNIFIMGDVNPSPQNYNKNINESKVTYRGL